jgi:DNA-binding NtrC family response regulator
MARVAQVRCCLPTSRLIECPAHLPPPSVLIVEDDEDTRASVMEMVRACGCEALEAVDANAALLILRGRPVDTIMTDYWLGPSSETGLEILSRAHDEGLLASTTLVTICSASSSVVAPACVPIATVLKKPIDVGRVQADLAAPI